MTVEAIETGCKSLSDEVTNFGSKCETDRVKMYEHAKKTIDDIPWYNIFAHIANWWNKAIEKINEGLAHVRTKINEAVNWLVENVLPWIAGPPMLAKSWVDWQDVAVDSAKVVGGMDLNQVKGAIQWQGPGAAAYATTVDQQKDAGSVTVAMIQGLQNFLSSHLNGLITFFTKQLSIISGLYAKLADFVVQFIGVADPLTWGDILSKAGGAIGGIITALAESVNNMVTYVTNGINAMAQVEQDSIAVAKLPGGSASWPKPGVNIDSGVAGGWSHS